MAQLVEKTVYMTKSDIIRYQILTHCFINRIAISKCDLDCLMLLGIYEEQELAEFCAREEISDELIKHETWYKDEFKSKGKKKGLFGSAQTVRNFLTRQEKIGLIVKVGNSRKKIKLNPEIGIVSNGSLVLNYKMAYIESQKS